MKAIFHPEASEETVESARFYETRSEVLARIFSPPLTRQLAGSSNSLRQVQSIKQTFASDSSQVSPSRFFTKSSLIESSSRL
jgi:hypothetical protein